MNYVALVGRLTADPEIRMTNQQTAIASFTVAADKRFKRDNGEATADFIPCTAFGKTAEFLEKYFHKGMRIGLTGRIETRTYTKQDGSKGYSWGVIAETTEFVESKQQATQEPPKQETKTASGWQNANADAPFTESELDELPFV